MNDFIDLHMHTIASGHAYNTLYEMVAAAVKNGVRLVGISDHGPAVQENLKRLRCINQNHDEGIAYRAAD